MCMKNKRVPSKFVVNEWDKVKCTCWPREPWLAQVDFRRKNWIS